MIWRHENDFPSINLKVNVLAWGTDYILFCFIFLIEYIYRAYALLKLIFIERILNKYI